MRAAVPEDAAVLVRAFEARCRAATTVRAAVLLTAGDADPRLLAAWPPGTTPPETLARASLQAWSESRTLVQPVDALRPAGARVLAGRIAHGGRVRGLVAVLLDGPKDTVERDLGRWRALVDVPQPRAETPRSRPGPAVATGGASRSRPPAEKPARTGGPALPPARDPAPAAAHGPGAPPAARVGEAAAGAMPDVQSRILVCQAAMFDAPEAATDVDAPLRALLATLAAQFRCDRVAFGWARPAGADVVAISHSAADRLSRDTMVPLATAMDEAIDQQSAVAWPGLPGRDSKLVVAQAQLARQSQAAAVCSVPLAAHGVPVGALTFERTEAFDDATLLELSRIAAFVAPVLALQRRAARPLATFVARLRTRLFGRVERLAIGIGALLLAIVATWLPLPDRVSAPARVEGAVQRTLTAPSDGWLMRVHVRPGDAVRADQVLIELDDRDLSLERLRWATEAEQADRQATEAIAREDRAQFAAHAARAAQARAQLALADAQLARQRVRAPFDGLVLAGDLTQSLGAPVRAGDTLVSVAPAGRHRIIVDVDERDVARIAVGGTGELALTAHAGRRVPIEIVRITPAAIARDGHTVFEVEARPSSDADLRPGYLGVAKLDADARPLLQSVFGRPWNALAQWLWAWGW